MDKTSSMPNLSPFVLESVRRVKIVDALTSDKTNCCHLLISSQLQPLIPVWTDSCLVFKTSLCFSCYLCSFQLFSILLLHWLPKCWQLSSITLLCLACFIADTFYALFVDNVAHICWLIVGWSSVVPLFKPVQFRRSAERFLPSESHQWTIFYWSCLALDFL